MMKVTREMKDSVNRRLQYSGDYLSDEGYAFYYQCLFVDKMNLLDADEYAILNTIIGYDIGKENAMAIISNLWENEIAVMELTGIDEDKDLVEKAIEELQIDIDLSKWSVMVDGYEYYIKED